MVNKYCAPFGVTSISVEYLQLEIEVLLHIFTIRVPKTSSFYKALLLGDSMTWLVYFETDINLNVNKRHRLRNTKRTNIVHIEEYIP